MKARKEIIFRNPSLKDVRKITELEKKVWGEEMYADDEKWIARITIFREGMLVAECASEIIGIVVMNVIKWNYNKQKLPTWNEVSGNGYLDNFDKNGGTIYGIDLTLLPGFQGVVRRLIKFGFDKRDELNLKQGFLGSRIPSLASRAENEGLSRENVDKDFVLQVCADDPEVNFFLRNGLEIYSPKKDYFPEDEESLGWGIVLKSKKTM